MEGQNSSIPFPAGLQMQIPDGGTRAYNPNRDVAHNFKFVVTEVAARLEDGRWPAVRAYLSNLSVDQEQLGEAMKAFITFVATAVNDPKETMDGALRRSGWFDVREPAQVAVMAYLGTVIAGIYFRGVREATLGGSGPCCDTKDLQEAGRLSFKLLTMPRWKRFFARAWLKSGRAIRGLFQRKN